MTSGILEQLLLTIMKDNVASTLQYVVKRLGLQSHTSPHTYMFVLRQLSKTLQPKLCESHQKDLTHKHILVDTPMQSMLYLMEITHQEYKDVDHFEISLSLMMKWSHFKTSSPIYQPPIVMHDKTLKENVQGRVHFRCKAHNLLHILIDQSIVGQHVVLQQLLDHISILLKSRSDAKIVVEDLSDQAL